MLHHRSCTVALAIALGGCGGATDPCATRSSPHSCLIARVVGDVANGELGFRFGEPLDVDGDGVGDLVGGARYANGVGYAAVWSAGKTELHRWPGELANGLFGQDALAVPDLDGDGRADVVVSAPNAVLPDGPRGVVDAYAASGKRIWRAIGELDEGLGWQLALAGDQDGDGVGDLWAGAPSSTRQGRVYLLSGRDGHVIRHIDSARSEDAFGWYMVATADLDGDGKPDVAIGAPYATVNGAQRGSVTVASSATGKVLLEVIGDRVGAHFGDVLAAIDDLDGDGVPDLAIGEPGTPLASNDLDATRGGVVLVSGKTGAILHRLEGEQPHELYGRMLATVDDLDGDGLRELAIGAPWYAAGSATRAGRIEVRSLRRRNVIVDLRGTVPDAWLGWNFARAGSALPGGKGIVTSTLRSNAGAGALELHAFR